MCMEVRKRCACGRENVQMHLLDNIMTPEVIAGLYCPACSLEIEVDGERMVEDNGWVIEYDMDVARFLAAAKLQMLPDDVTPGFLFDSGYATWREMYPGEQEDILKEREAFMALLKEDPRRYLAEINRWNIERVEGLKAAGWRKAQFA